MTEFEPIPESSGSLEPPRRRPPTAVGAATPAWEHHPVPPEMHEARRRKTSPLTLAVQLIVGVPLLGVRFAVRKVRALVH